MAQAKRDENSIPTLLGVSNADGSTPVTVYVDPTTHRMLVSSAGSGSVALDDLTDATITSAAQGDLFYYNGTAWVNLAAGTSGQFLKTQGAGANPIWATSSVSITGTDTHVLFFDGANSPAGDAGFTYNKTTDTATLAGNLQCEDLLLEDSNASHYLTITTTSDLTATRTLTLVPGDASRSITMAGNLNIAADFITSGANSLTLTTTGSTNVTLPTTGTLTTTLSKLSVFAATSSAELAGVISDETGSGALMFGTSPVITTDITIPNSGLHVLDTNASHDLVITPGSDLTADRILTITTGDAARSVTLAGNINVAADLITSGANSLTLTTTGATNVTLPTTGTLVNSAVTTLSSLVSVGTLTSGNADAIVSAASLTLAGKVELATTAEINTGTDSTRAIPVDQFVASNRNVRYILFRVIDKTTDWSADASTAVGGDLVIPFTGTIVDIEADSDTAGTTGTAVVDVNLNGTTIMSTNKLKWDSTEKSTRTYSGTAHGLTTTAVTSGGIITLDIDTNHTTKSKGLTLFLAIRLT